MVCTPTDSAAGAAPRRGHRIIVLGRAGPESLLQLLRRLSRRGVGAAPLDLLAAALQLHSCGLTELSLRFNELGDAGAGALGKALCSNGVLRSLNLGGNLIGPEGVVQLAEGLRHNASLACLNLRSNRAGDAGAVAVAQMLCDNGSLRELYLGCNGIDEAGALALAHSWRANTALEKVDVQGALTLTQP